MRHPPNVRLQELVNKDLLVEFKLAEVLLEPKCLRVVLDPVELEVQDVRWVLDPVLAYADFVGTSLCEASDLSAADILPVVKEAPIL